MVSFRRLAVVAYPAVLLLPQGMFGQELATNSGRLLMESGTPVKLQLLQTISSAHARKGDVLEFVVANDVEVGGYTVIRAGAQALGSVVAVKGKRPLGMGGHVILKLDSVELSNGERVPLVASREFKGRAHTIRMAVGMALTAAFYVPATPALLMTRGRDSTVLKGTEVTAYTKGEAWMQDADLPMAQEDASGLNAMMKLLPPRALNEEGRAGDMLNLIFVAKEDELQQTFARAGWLKVEKSVPQIIWHLAWQRKHYTKLPMNRLYVFGRAQDYSYAMPDPRFVVAQRHHLRIWRTDRLVNGIPVWVAAATHDVSIEFVRRRFWVNHRIDPNVDAERDFIAGNLAETQQLRRQEYVHCAEPVYSAQTATGQAYYSDSRMLLLELHRNELVPPVSDGTQVAGKLPLKDSSVVKPEGAPQK
jgi:LssY-like putative type I secretion system component LssY